MVDIVDTTVSEITAYKNFKDVVEQYSRLDNHPDVKAGIDINVYLNLEKAGLLKVVAVVDGDTLCGFGTVVTTYANHLAQKVAWIESLYVLPKYRVHNTGVRLLKHLMQKAKETGCVGCSLTAQKGSELEKVYSRLYKATDTVFWKSFKEEK